MERVGKAMIAHRKRPFQDMTAEGWQNLALASLLLFYLIYTALQAILHTICGQMGVDYCDYWSAGRVANLYGYVRVYDVQTLEQIQKSILPAAADPSQIAVVPFPYLPVFLLPFQLLSLLSPEIGFWIWNAINITVFFLYIQSFSRRLNQQPAPARLMLLLFASLPVYLDIFSGQVAVWLAVCVGEFMLALVTNKPFRAGLWLGGLLLKPQLLVVIGLALLIQRAIRILAGLAVSSSLLLAASLLLSGTVGLVQMLKLWLTYGNGTASIWLEGMMNWRMLGFHVSALTNSWIGWGITAIGMLGTLVITLYVWRRPLNLRSPAPGIALLGILAASAIVAWHSHIHTAMILIPPIIYLYQAKILPHKALNYWVFLPATLYLVIAFIPEALMKLNISSDAIGRFIYFFIGASEFGVTFYLFWWAAGATRQGVDA
jgi:hypothetical protein